MPEMTQHELQIWNDAVAECLRLALAEVDTIEREAANGMPSPARTVVRALSGAHRPGDVRQTIDLKIDMSAWPKLKTP